MNGIKIFRYLCVPVFLFCSIQCATSPGAGSEVFGFGILERLPGQWNGPVMTTTPAGSFNGWWGDFRPISPGQVSQFSNVDAQTINYLSFFVVRHKGALKVAMRTEGVFQGEGCVTYEVIDTVREAEGYYRFSDFIAGDARAFTEFTFRNDQLLMEVYTNKFNQVSPLEVHTRWEAVLGSRDAAEAAKDYFNFPQPEVVMDFTDVFRHMSESIYYNLEIDPYKSNVRPHVGSVTVNIALDESLPVSDTDELFLLLTTESLFEVYEHKRGNWKYFSKYVFLPIGTESFTITHVHPGEYYLYSYNDINGDKRHLSGDYMSSNLLNIFTLLPESNVQVDTYIDFIIP
jgi:hypothetical protein